MISQAYNEGWKAYEIKSCQLSAHSCQLKHLLPFLFGKELKEHVLVNNWANAWVLDPKSAVQLKHEPSEFIPREVEGNSSEKANAEIRRRWLLGSQESGVQSTTCSTIVAYSDTSDCVLLTVYLFFLPQLLEWIGFLFLPIPFLLAWRMKKEQLG